MQTIYEKELQQLKDWDEVQHTEILQNGYSFIHTAGHGYLVVPVSDSHISTARKICDYGFKGQHAVYLEEDCEASTFLQELKGQ